MGTGVWIGCLEDQISRWFGSLAAVGFARLAFFGRAASFNGLLVLKTREGLLLICLT